MSDFKSKLPDFQELTKITGKFFNDMKNSVCEIVEEYKKKRAEENVGTPGDVTSSDTPPPPPPPSVSPEEVPPPGAPDKTTKK
ncbi:MAG: hypothetical protein Q8M03_11790 [Legionella sp.]|nr:hypothetical protein [Legionella sp.]